MSDLKILVENLNQMTPEQIDGTVAKFEEQQTLIVDQQEHLLKMGGISKDMAKEIAEYLPNDIVLESFTGVPTQTNLKASLMALEAAQGQTSTSLAVSYIAAAAERLRSSQDVELPRELESLGQAVVSVKASGEFRKEQVRATDRLDREVRKALYQIIAQDVPADIMKQFSEWRISATMLNADLLWRANQEGCNVATAHMLTGQYESLFVVIRSQMALIEDILQSYHRDFFPAVLKAMDENGAPDPELYQNAVQIPNGPMAKRTVHDLVEWSKSISLRVRRQHRLSWVMKVLRGQQDLPTMATIKVALWHSAQDGDLKKANFGALSEVSMPGVAQYRSLYEKLPSFAEYSEGFRDLTKKWGEFSNVGPEMAQVVVDACRALVDVTEDLVSCKQLLDLEIASYVKAANIHKDAAKFGFKQLRQFVEGSDLEPIEKAYEQIQA